MDKFGIFELLDTLSQIAAERTDDNFSEPSAPAPHPLPDDKSFLPPNFNGEPLDEGQKMQRDALTALYDRHESIAKKIDKKK